MPDWLRVSRIKYQRYVKGSAMFLSRNPRAQNKFSYNYIVTISHFNNRRQIMTKPIDKDTIFYTMKEIAEIMRVRPSTIRKHIAAGELPAMRVSRSEKSVLRVRKEDFDEWAKTRWVSDKK
jgi:excisionase family DNA binding protein